jgi:hypothetical protein
MNEHMDLLNMYLYFNVIYIFSMTTRLYKVDIPISNTNYWYETTFNSPDTFSINLHIEFDCKALIDLGDRIYGCE